MPGDFLYVSLLNTFSTSTGGGGSTTFVNNITNNNTYQIVTGGTTNVTQNVSSYSGPVISAGGASQGSGTVVFSNSNGVSFGLAAGVVTASFSGGTGGGGAGTGFTGTNATGTLNSAGLAISVAAPGAGGGATINGSTGNVSLVAGANITLSTAGSTISIVGGAGGGGAGTNGAITGGSMTVNTSGISINLPAYLTTAQPPGAYLTTTRFQSLNEIQNASGDVLFTFGIGRQIQFQFSNTGTFTTNANKQGLFEIDVQGNLVDGADAVHVHQSDNDPTIDLLHLEAWGTNVTALRISASASVAAEINKPIKFVGTGANTASVPLILGTGQSNSVANLNANYLQGQQSSFFANSTHTHSQYQSTGAYLTTAALSNHTHGSGPSITGSIGVTSASNAWSISIPAFLTTAQPVGAYLTTARASNDAVGLNTAATSVTWTVNSGGISLNAGAYLTTAMASNAGTGFMSTSERANYFATNANTFANSTHTHGGLTLNVTNITTSITSASNGLTINLSAGGGVTNQTGPNIAVPGTTINSGDVVFSNANGVSFGLNGSTMTASVNAGGAAPAQYYAFVGEDVPQARALITNVTALDQRPLFFPFDVGGNLSANEIHWTMSRSTSNSNAFTVVAGIYSFSNSTRIDLISSTQVAYSATATASISGVRAFECPMPVTSLSAGQYVLGIIFSANGGNTASMNYSLMGGTTANPAVVNVILTGTDAYHTYTSHGVIPFWGRYTVNSTALPASIPFTNVIHGFTGASQPLPVHFQLGNHY